MASMGLPLTDDEFDVINSSYPHKEAYGEVDKGIGYLEFISLMSDQVKYVPGSGEYEQSDNYFGNTTQNSAYAAPATPNTYASRPGTMSSLSQSGKTELTRVQAAFGRKIFSKFHDLRAAFRAADKDASGFIEIGEFDQLLSDALGIQTDSETVVDMMSLFDANNDGKLSYKEFVQCLHTL